MNVFKGTTRFRLLITTTMILKSNLDLNQISEDLPSFTRLSGILDIIDLAINFEFYKKLIHEISKWEIFHSDLVLFAIFTCYKLSFLDVLK
jgi:hypothetical protein